LFLSYDEIDLPERCGRSEMGKILVGISTWNDAELIESGFFPPEIKTSGERLSYYALKFPVVELDSSYHFLPTARNLAGWIQAAPPGFVFDVKAFSLLTQHPGSINSLPRDLREQAGSASAKENLYLHHLPAAVIDQLWERFTRAILTLSTAGKLGLVTFQFPPWFHPGAENYRYIAACKSRLSGFRVAVEFRTGSWLNDERRKSTLGFLKENDIGLVCVDEPQGLASSVPPLAEITASFGVVRFHGRNRENWEKKNIIVNERYNYLYSEAELREWAPKLQSMAAAADEVVVIFKNKHCDFAVQNAQQMRALLD
jgi:uncharacterized protein YecE (DUF72 family)